MAASILHPLDKKSAALAFVLGLATILGAWGSQIIGGLYPCELCLEQRMAYYIGLPILLGVMVLWNRLPLKVWYVAMAIVTAIFAWGVYMGSYHAGVEWGFWPGPTACTGVGDAMDFDALSNMTPVIGCDVVQFRFLGISLAGFNALISLAMVALLIVSIVAQMRHTRKV
ncbi:disulfide bond formation protein B [Devosia neptuniae]|mgnify:CR=1 FL=1|jgi:disulfide bond formation protein DsbB|uniref:disulfide bond formation protein B n=1 Tax=Devosia TaxID=46913 RepID=UPI0022AFC612|nr:disulfide bond formation protein B [Devosia neptuniae]MCZ4347564.1 disulfide bond formation protein B [Devosia neptuniae]|tara:strand:+ start:60631 stop:61140 length:510 start_codon:yes stop_codon:yes gene_type:complete